MAAFAKARFRSTIGTLPFGLGLISFFAFFIN